MRPSALRSAARHCARVLDYSAAEVPYDRAIFAAGIAAHHVLQAVGERQSEDKAQLEPEQRAEIGRAVIERLITTGRKFDGRPEPPLNIDSAWEGYELAIDYLDFYPLPSSGRFEVGLGVDADWKPTGYDEAWFHCICDLVYQTEDFATEAVELVVLDYKSAWPTNGDALNTLQRKAQAVVAAAHYGSEVDQIRLEVVNLRTQVHYSKLVSMEDEATLERWRSELAISIKALGIGPRAASPGAGCEGCPYLLSCPEAQDYFERSEIIWEHGSNDERARAFAVAGAMVGRLRAKLKPVTADGPIDLGDTLVGFEVSRRRKPKPDAGIQLWDKWQSRGGQVHGMMNAAVPGMSQLESAAKILWSDKANIDRRERFVNQLTEPDNRAEFKARKK